MRTDFYILVGREPQAESDLLAWAAWFGHAARRVAFTDLGHGATVSTAFLGIDHRICGDGPPLLFETMTFFEEDETGPRGNVCLRTSTWAEAEAMHAAVVANIRGQADGL